MMPEQKFGGNSMAAPLARVMACPPEAAGRPDPGCAAQWPRLGYLRARRTIRRLQKCGFETITFSGGEVGMNGNGGPACLTRPLLRCCFK